MFKLSERPEQPELALVSALLPFYTILFGVTADGGGAVVTANGEVVKVRHGQVTASWLRWRRASGPWDRPSLPAKPRARPPKASQELRGQSVKELQNTTQTMKGPAETRQEVDAER